jgi:hypothetical protein
VATSARCYWGAWWERHPRTEVSYTSSVICIWYELIPCSMREFSRWPGLKHFNQVTTVPFKDGQSFFDILKVWDLVCFQIIYWILTVHPTVCRGDPSTKQCSNPLSPCISASTDDCRRALHAHESVGAPSNLYCRFLPLVFSMSHICLQGRIKMKLCVQHVSKTYGKDFGFFKQHATSHIVADIFQEWNRMRLT